MCNIFNFTFSYIVKHAIDGSQIWEHIMDLSDPLDPDFDEYDIDDCKIYPTNDGGAFCYLYADRSIACITSTTFEGYKVDGSGVFEYKKKMFHTDMDAIPLQQITSQDTLEYRRMGRLGFSTRLMPNGNIEIYENTFIPSTSSNAFDPTDFQVYTGSYGSSTPIVPYAICDEALANFSPSDIFEFMNASFLDVNFDYSQQQSTQKFQMGVVKYQYDPVNNIFSNEQYFMGNGHDLLSQYDLYTFENKDKFIIFDASINSTTGKLSQFSNTEKYFYETDEDFNLLAMYDKKQDVHTGPDDSLSFYFSDDVFKQNGVMYGIAQTSDPYFAQPGSFPNDIMIVKFRNSNPITLSDEKISFSHNTTIYPNPSSNNHFRITTDQNIKHVHVRNIIGQSIPINFTENEHIVTFSKDIPAGIYLVEITNENKEVEIKRFVKK